MPTAKHERTGALTTRFWRAAVRVRGCWNGASWHVQQTAAPVGHKALNAVSCAAPGTCTAVGASYTLVNGHLQPLAERE